MIYLVVFAAGVLVGMYLKRSRSGGQPGPSYHSASMRDVTDAEVEELLRQGKKLEALRRYREIHRCDVATASQMVDALERLLRR